MQAATERGGICIHCGTAFRPSRERPDFCCAGCQFVHDLIAKHGLAQFYDLQEGGIQPVRSLVFQKRDYTWLEELVRDAEKSGSGHLRLDVQGLSCIGCVWLVERLFGQRPGALSIRADSALGEIDLRWETGVFDVVEFARELQSFGYAVGPLGKRASRADRGLILRLGVCGALAMNTMLFTLPSYLGMASNFTFAPLFHQLSLILGTLSLLIGGSYFFIRSWRSLRMGVLHIDLPISIGLIAAWLGSIYASRAQAFDFVYFDFVSTFVFLMLVGRWLQQRMVARNRNQLLAVQGELPPVKAASGELVPIDQLHPGLVYSVGSGQVVPVRSRLESPAAVLGMEGINGESETTVAPRGRMVPAGAVNSGESTIQLEAKEVWSDSLLAKLMHITVASSSRDLAVERFIRGYIATVVCVGITGFLAWWFVSGDLLRALQVLISVLVVSCPCASGVAIPLCTDLAASRLRNLGVFVRDSAIWAKLLRVRKVIFDKTGTLTPSAISLRNPEVVESLTAEERTVLTSMIYDSVHPVSGCLREQLMAAGTEPLLHTPIKEVVGCGLSLEREGVTWRLGRPEWIESPESLRGEERGNSGDCIFARNDEVIARFSFGELERDDATSEIHALRARGIGVFILSGDRQEKVATMGRRLGLAPDQCVGELSPQEKASRVRELDAHDTLYVGDGANDSLAFDSAWCTATPAIDRGLLEQKADFYFLGKGLSGIRAVLDMGLVRRRAVKAVVSFAILYNAVAVALCLSGKMSPLLAAVLMPASSLVSLGIVFAGMSRFASKRQSLLPSSESELGNHPNVSPLPVTAAANHVGQVAA